MHHLAHSPGGGPWAAWIASPFAPVLNRREPWPEPWLGHRQHCFARLAFTSALCPLGGFCDALLQSSSAHLNAQCSMPAPAGSGQGLPAPFFSHTDVAFSTPAESGLIKIHPRRFLQLNRFFSTPFCRFPLPPFLGEGTWTFLCGETNHRSLSTQWGTSRPRGFCLIPCPHFWGQGT